MRVIKNPSTLVELCRHLQSSRSAVAVVNVQPTMQHSDEARALALCEACYAQTATALQRMTSK